MASLRAPTMLAAALSLLSCFQPSLVAAGPVTRRSDLVVKDFHRAPRAWTNLGRAPTEHLIHLTIGLSQSRFDELERRLYEVSDPSHPRYGQHLSVDEVNELVKPSDDASAAVHEWLEEYGIDMDQLAYSPAKDWISIPLPVSTIEDMLNTEYSVWEHQDGSTIVRTEGYSLPHYVHKHITTIQPTNSWARLEGHKKRTEIMKRSVIDKRTTHVLEAADTWEPPSSIPPPENSTVYAACNFTHVTPDCVRTLYGTIDYEVKAAGLNKMAHTNYLEEATNRSDISQFLTMYRPEAASYAYEFEAISIAGGLLDNGTNVAATGQDREANLDAEYMIGIGYPTPLIAYHTGGRNPTFVPDINTEDNSDEPFLVWAQYLAGLPDDEIPQVVSTSYGDDEQTVSRSYAQAVCNQFAQLGARGVSLFFSSGDFGVGTDETCISNEDNTTAMFMPSFPADCPYVTAVGATTGYPESAAWRKLSSGLYFNSGAGFSNYFDMPAYQAETVNAYVDGLGGLYDGLYNKSGRAYPDIAAIGQLFPVLWNGTTVNLVGTSGSSPIAAAVFALLNDALISEGRPPVGFLNPWLYKSGHLLFTDVNNGSSAGCNTSGFPATDGWDAVTGWGTPYLPKLLEAFGLEK
ncbi:Tripeptidyl-peptidase sed3 [Cladophialophora carrionii]|uniref:tripeptidyl-peptidase II n=1 Tax=Cladophialophora carrionii TaxID=86049 RepID=A0A1C1CGU9_9EURO|nr:Tripeptidyl-peptidase sed3 [Cladophialophora carrionii]